MSNVERGALPHRAEHIGSLLRPRELKDAFRAHAQGQLHDASFRRLGLSAERGDATHEEVHPGAR